MKTSTSKAKTRTKRKTNVEDYRHDEAKRKNNPPAKIAAEGTVPAIPKARYACNPHLPPVSRSDATGRADVLETRPHAQIGPAAAASQRNAQPSRGGKRAAWA